MKAGGEEPVVAAIARIGRFLFARKRRFDPVQTSDPRRKCRFGCIVILAPQPQESKANQTRKYHPSRPPGHRSHRAGSIVVASVPECDTFSRLRLGPRRFNPTKAMRFLKKPVA